MFFADTLKFRHCCRNRSWVHVTVNSRAMFLAVIVALTAVHYSPAASISFDIYNASSYCLDGLYHKEKPGPEDELHEQVNAPVLGIY